MTVSFVSEQRCELYSVVRTDLRTFDKQVLTYAPTDFMGAVARAAHYQREFDPSRERYDYRVYMWS